MNKDTKKAKLSEALRHNLLRRKESVKEEKNSGQNKAILRSEANKKGK